MWTYEQRSGRLLDADGSVIGKGYAGFGKSKNVPEDDHLKNLGPLPKGEYRIGPPFTSPSVGPYALPLIPNPANEMHHRSLFRIHGDSAKTPGAASNGCIVMQRAVRELIWKSDDHLLRVVA